MTLGDCQTRCSATYSEEKRSQTRGKVGRKRIEEDDQHFRSMSRRNNPEWKDRKRDRPSDRPKKNVTGTFFSARTLEECNINESMRAALLKMNIERPSHIQVKLTYYAKNANFRFVRSHGL